MPVFTTVIKGGATSPVRQAQEDIKPPLRGRLSPPAPRGSPGVPLAQGASPKGTFIAAVITMEFISWLACSAWALRLELPPSPSSVEERITPA